MTAQGDMTASLAQRIFEFRRQGDAVVYTFRPAQDPMGKLAWKREDASLWCRWVAGKGWSVVDSAGTILAWPQSVPLHQQGDAPPAGEWISVKGDKSYRYELVYR